MALIIQLNNLILIYLIYNLKIKANFEFLRLFLKKI